MNLSSRISQSMSPVRAAALALAGLAGLAATGLSPRLASAQNATTTPAPPDDALLGAVEVDGSGSGILPLPKLGIAPAGALDDTDRTVQAVIRKDLDLSGQYEVIGDEKAPDPSAARTAPVDLAAWHAKGVEVVVRVFAELDGASSKIVAEAWLTRGNGASPVRGETQEAPKPVYRAATPSGTDARAAAHRVTDELLGALTGRPGAFASHLTFVKRDKAFQTAQTLDSDGFNLQSASPQGLTVLSPAFGPNGVLYYAVSRDYSPFRVAAGPRATELPLAVPGSVLGLAISPEGNRAALTVMVDGKSSILVGENGKLSTLTAAPLAHHPAFGPLGKVAYVGGTPVQRVHVDGTAVSPAGFMASAPTFCDTQQGLLVVFTVEVQGGAELVSTDSRGGNMRRLTQRQGENRYPACSPDGRMVAFFSTTKTGQGPGLYVMPVSRPWLAKKISSEIGLGLRWERLPQAKAAPPSAGSSTSPKLP